MSLRNKTFYGILWTFTTNMSMRVLNFFINIILARLLIPSDFGLMALILTVINFFEIIRELGIGQAIIQKNGNADDMANSAFFMFPLISLVLYAIVYLIAPFSAEFFGEAEIEEMMRVVALSLIIWSFGSLPQTLLTKELEFKKISVSQILPRIIYGIVTILMAFRGLGVWSLVWGKIIIETISVITYWNILKWRPSLKFDIRTAFALLSYGKHVIVASLLIFLASVIDITIIGRILGTEKLGYYSLALTISGIFTTQISATLSQVLFPAYSKVQENKEKLSWAYLKTLKGISIITFPAAFGILSVSWLFIKIFYGEKWLPTVVPLQILCIYGLNISILNVTKNLYLAVGKPQIMEKVYFVQLFLILILAYPFTSKYGIFGTSIAVTISSTVSMFFTINEAKKLIDKNLLDIINSMLPSSIGSILMISVVFAMQKLCDNFQPHLVFLLSIILGSSSYYLFLYMVYKKEINELKLLVGSRLKIFS